MSFAQQTQDSNPSCAVLNVMDTCRWNKLRMLSATCASALNKSRNANVQHSDVILVGKGSQLTRSCRGEGEHGGMTSRGREGAGVEDGWGTKIGRGMG